MYNHLSQANDHLSNFCKVTPLLLQQYVAVQ